jgi:phosphoglycerate kinase
MSAPVRRLSDLDVAGKRVLMRVDFNVPLDAEGRVSDDTRIRAALPTLREVRRRGGRLVLMSHLGRPKGEDDRLRLDAVGRRLQELLEAPVLKLSESTGPGVEQAVQEASGETVVLLENVRFNPGEKRGDAELAAAYARLGDVFVNDAFGTSHRAEASVCGVAALLPSAAGLLLEREIEAFRRVLEAPQRPFVAILGGAKVSDKLSVIGNLLDKVDTLLVGGGMAYTFLRAQGLEVGQSLVEEERLETVRAALGKAQERGVELLLPVDHVAADRFAPDAEARECGPGIPAGWMGLDIGPRTRAAYAERVGAARTVVWNGPMGVFEMERFRAGTEAVGRAVAACEGYTVVGGGDSVAAIELLGLSGRIDHISTGGGASLELLEGKDLPGIAALRA